VATFVEGGWRVAGSVGEIEKGAAFIFEDLREVAALRVSLCFAD
jgi:hypothetical protein